MGKREGSREVRDWQIGREQDGRRGGKRLGNPWFISETEQGEGKRHEFVQEECEQVMDDLKGYV